MADAQAAHSGGHAHVLPIWKYLAVFVALIVLTGATVAAAFTNLGPLNNVVALGIAGLKATLVILYFMHVRYSSRMIPLVVVAGVFWLLLLISGTLSDYLTRGLFDVPGK
jgi:cytochrome c oxidase subunit 4